MDALERDASPELLEAIRRIFYAGAWSALDVLTCYGPNQTEEQAEAQLELVFDEVQAFRLAVRRGDA